MSDVRELRDLYQEVILEHSKKPKNFRAIETANHKAEGFNPLCGDHFTVYVDVKDGAINDIGFQGSGCAISKASASMMTQMLKGKTETEADSIFTKFHDLVTGPCRRWPGPGEAGGFCRRFRISAAGKVRDAGLACTCEQHCKGDQEAVSTE